MNSERPLPDGWAWATLDEVRAPGRSVVSGPFGSAIGSRFFVEAGIPVIRGSNLSTDLDRFREDAFVYLTPEKAAEFSNCEAIADDLVFTAAGTIGQVGLIPRASKHPKYIISNKQLRARLDPTRVHPEFAYYWYASPAMVQTIQSRNTGSTIPLINLSVLKSLPIPVPPLSEQKAIASQLSLLDRRINLLRETNATLEAIAQALFKSWFVDFDPVRAKRDGRAPEGMDEATAALFPDSFEDSELGEAPKGWEVCCIEQIADRIGMGPFGSNIKVETFVDQGVPVLNGANVQGAIVEEGGFRFITAEHALRLRNSCVQSGDIVITHRGTLGQVAIVPSRSQYPEYVCSQSQFFLRCDSRLMQPEWMLYFLRSAGGQHLLLSNAAQVGVPSIARPTSHLRSMRLLVPPPELVRQYSNVVRSLHESVVLKREHIATLASLRDTLLPRLISGQLRLPEFEKDAQAA